MDREQIYAQWRETWQKLNSGYAALAEEEPAGEGAYVGDPASQEEIEETERTLGVPLPPSLRQTLTEFASSIEVVFSSGDYQFDEGVTWENRDESPENQIKYDIGGCGSCYFMLELEQMVVLRQAMADILGTDPDTVCEETGLLPFAGADESGDMICFDLNDPNEDKRVVYFAQDGEDTGKPLADNFIDFVSRWTRAGCVGLEMYCGLRSVLGENGIDPDGVNAQYLRKKLGIDE